MKKVGTYILRIILLVNIAVIVLLLIAAYSSYLSPSRFPVLSCFGLAYMVFFAVNIVFLLFWVFARPLYALAPLAGIIFTFGALRQSFPVNFGGGDEGRSLKVLSYNVMGLCLQKPHKDDDRNAVLDYIAASGADIVCMQEYILSTNQHFLNEDDVLRALDMYPYHATVQLNYSGNPNQLACFSKYPIIDSQRIAYDSANNGSAIFTLSVDGDTVVVINNHLESNKLTAADKAAYASLVDSPSAERIKENFFSLVGKLADAAAIRAEQARAVRAVMDEHLHQPLIVCGDFNDGPLSYAHRVLNDGMQDAFTRRGRGLGISYNENKFFFRIDNILVNDEWEVVSCKVDDTIEDSDHYPIIAELRLAD